jgi:hypothetical protein
VSAVTINNSIMTIPRVRVVFSNRNFTNVRSLLTGIRSALANESEIKLAMGVAGGLEKWSCASLKIIYVPRTKIRSPMTGISVWPMLDNRREQR